MTSRFERNKSHQQTREECKHQPQVDDDLAIRCAKCRQLLGFTTDWQEKEKQRRREMIRSAPRFSEAERMIKEFKDAHPDRWLEPTRPFIPEDIGKYYVGIVNTLFVGSQRAIMAVRYCEGYMPFIEVGLDYLSVEPEYADCLKAEPNEADDKV